MIDPQREGSAAVPNQWSGVTIDCVDPVRMSTFWGHLLGIEPSYEHGDDPGWAPWWSPTTCWSTRWARVGASRRRSTSLAASARAPCRRRQPGCAAVSAVRKPVRPLTVPAVASPARRCAFSHCRYSSYARNVCNTKVASSSIHAPGRGYRRRLHGSEFPHQCSRPARENSP